MKPATCLLALMLLPLVVKADTLTLTNNSSLNGSVLYDKDVFVVEAVYKFETKYYRFPRSAVEKVEINFENFNPGAPPLRVTAFRVGPQVWATMKTPSDKQPAKKSAGRRPSESDVVSVDDTVAVYRSRRDVVLVNDKEQTGTLIKVDAKVVVLRKTGEQTNTQYPRRDVQVITVGR